MARIEKIFTKKEPVTEARRAMAHVTGKKIVEREDFYFEDQEMKQKYKWVLGAFCIGGLGANSFALILGADFEKLENNKRRVLCIAEAEYQTLERLAKGLRSLTDDWIGSEYKFQFYSDLDDETGARFHQLSGGIIVYPGYYYNKPNAFEQYRQSLIIHKGLLVTETAPLLRIQMADFRTDDVLDPGRVPAVVALAFGVDALMERCPWKVSVKSEPDRYIDFPEES